MSVAPQTLGSRVFHAARASVGRIVAALGCLALVVPPLAAQEKPASGAATEASRWPDQDARLASEYLNLLVEKPEYGRVLDLLWSLYEKHDATAFLLESIATQAGSQSHPHVLLVHAHLLRKAGDFTGAVRRYDEVLKLDAANGIALRARADLSRDKGEHQAALEFLRRLGKTYPASSMERATLLLEEGTAALAAGKPEEASVAWENAVKLQPENVSVVQQAAQHLLGAGFLEKAITLYRTLASSGEPARRLDALYDLSRLEEQADHLEEAVKALREGLAMLHFKDWRYGQFFQRLVRLHERFNQLDALKADLIKAAQHTPPGEQALSDLARFSGLVVDGPEKVRWLRELVKAFPASTEHRWELVRALFDNEEPAEAARLLDESLKGDASDPASLVIMRCEAHLQAREQAKAEARLKSLLTAQGTTAEVEKMVLQFAQQRSLDRIIEQILRNRLLPDPGKTELVFELASFLVKRQREPEAVAVLESWLKVSPGNSEEMHRRLRAIASFFGTAGKMDLAEQFAQRSAQDGASPPDYLALADILAQRGATQEAQPLLEKAWKVSTTHEQRLEVDERLLALLSGDQSLRPLASQKPVGTFQLPAIFTGEGFGSEAPPQQSKVVVPEAVLDYARGLAVGVYVSRWLETKSQRAEGWGLGRVISAARGLSDSLPGASDEAAFRAAWWAFRAELTQLAYDLVRLIHFDKNNQWITAPMEVEKLLLDISISDQNTLLAIRQLHLLSTIDASNKTTYLLRLAEQEGRRPSFTDTRPTAMPREQDPTSARLMRFMETRSQAQLLRTASQSLDGVNRQGPATAIRILEQLAKEDPRNESVLSALSQFYLENGQRDNAMDLWKKAAGESPTTASPVLERYAELLVAQGQHKAYVQTQMQILEGEADVKRRRDAFSRALERLLWVNVVQGSLPEEEARRRLDIMLTALQERSRRSPFDGFWHEALAAVHDKLGEAAKAFSEMKQAYYAAPDTPFSLEQLRTAALKADDLRSAIYFQKQIAATASNDRETAEWRELVSLLEQDFRMAEADQARRRLELHSLHDPAALSELAVYYEETGQDDAARRVHEQLARVRSWDVKNLLRLALQQLQAGDAEAAEKTLLQLLQTSAQEGKVQPQQVEKLPWPILDERKAQPVAPAAMLASLESSPGLEQGERDRLRALLGVPRGDLTEVPEIAAQVRLRAVEELMRLRRRGIPEAPASQIYGDLRGLSEMERAWMLLYAGDGTAFRTLVKTRLAGVMTLEAQFLHVWLGLRSHGMKEMLDWVESARGKDTIHRQRRNLLQIASHMLADEAGFEFSVEDAGLLGRSDLFSDTELRDVARKLEVRRRYAAAYALGSQILHQADNPALSNIQLAHLAERMHRPDLQYHHLKQAWSLPLSVEIPQGQDLFVECTASLMRLAPSPAERARILRESWQRLRRLPPSGQGAMREARLLGLAGADLAAGHRLGQYLGNGFLAAHPFAEPFMSRPPTGAPAPGPRIDELNHMRNYWENLREWSELLRQEGMVRPLLLADQELLTRLGGVPVGSKAHREYSTWRLQMLVRQLRTVSHRERVRLVQEFLESDDSVDTLQNLGTALEMNGMPRIAVEVYRRLPERAPANAEYCEQLLRVCENSWESAIAIPYIERLFTADPQYRPLNLPENLLETKHARFLARLQDTVQLQFRAMSGITTMRSSGPREPSQVPYLKELALLLERQGDVPRALKVWEDLAVIWPQEVEAHVHRARLLIQQGNKARALAAVQSVDFTNLWSDATRDALQIRAKLAAEAGNWDEMRELMNLVTRGPNPGTSGPADVGFMARMRLNPMQALHTGSILSLSNILAARGRKTEAQSLLLRSERALQEPMERFRLRLAQLKLDAADPTWNPHLNQPRVAALLRLETPDEMVLREWVAFMKKEAAGPRASAWISTLEALPPSPSASVGLAAMAPRLTEKAIPRLVQPWKEKQDVISGVAQQVTVNTLLAEDRPAWALAVALTGHTLRDAPSMARVLLALGDRARIQEFYGQLVRMPSPGGRDVIGFMEAFAAGGRIELAQELAALALDDNFNRGKSDPELVLATAELFIKQRQYEKAETLLLKSQDGMGSELAEILASLYRAWNKLDRLPAELAKFQLPDGLLQETLFLAKSSPAVKP